MDQSSKSPSLTAAVLLSSFLVPFRAPCSAFCPKRGCNLHTIRVIPSAQLEKKHRKEQLIFRHTLELHTYNFATPRWIHSHFGTKFSTITKTRYFVDLDSTLHFYCACGYYLLGGFHPGLGVWRLLCRLGLLIAPPASSGSAAAMPTRVISKRLRICIVSDKRGMGA